MRTFLLTSALLCAGLGCTQRAAQSEGENSNDSDGEPMGEVFEHRVAELRLPTFGRGGIAAAPRPVKLTLQCRRCSSL